MTGNVLDLESYQKPPMLLYHCFPRKRKCTCSWCNTCEEESLALSVLQLQTMVEYGLVMTPETLTIPDNPRATTGAPPRTTFTQTRACFTLATRHELWSDRKFATDGAWRTHSQVFGNFAIGLTSDAGRQLGAVPVFYYYKEPGNAGERINMTHEALFVLREMRSLAIALAWLEAKAPSVTDEDVWTMKELIDAGHVLDEEAFVKERIQKAKPEEADIVAALLETRRPAACNLVERINIVLGFFQAVDAPPARGGHQHEYYEQREWRIGHVFGPHVLGTWLKQNSSGDHRQAALRQRLHSQNPCFFDSERLEHSAVLHGLAVADTEGRQSFFDFVTEVICPQAAKKQVENLLLDLDFEKQEGRLAATNSALKANSKGALPVVFAKRR